MSYFKLGIDKGWFMSPSVPNSPTDKLVVVHSSNGSCRYDIARWNGTEWDINFYSGDVLAWRFLPRISDSMVLLGGVSLE